MIFVDSITGEHVGVASKEHAKGEEISFAVSRKLQGTPSHERYRVVGGQDHVIYVEPIIEHVLMESRIEWEVVPDTLWSGDVRWWLAYTLGEGQIPIIQPLQDEALGRKLMKEYKDTGGFMTIPRYSTSTLHVRRVYWAHLMHSDETPLRVLPKVVDMTVPK
jgi:hypothetical protein